jgi:hypothetical protein
MIGWPETLIVQQGDGPTLSAAAAATCLSAQGKKTLPANFFNYIGQTLRIEAAGRISSIITTPGTARFDIRLGGSVIFDSAAILLDTVAAHTTRQWRLVIDMTVRVVGSAGNFFGHGLWTCEDILGTPATAPKGSLSAVLPWNTTPAVGGNADFTTAGVLDMFFTQTEATGSMTVHQYSAAAPNGY